MIIIETNIKEYLNVINTSYHIFNSVKFIELNATKYDDLYYLLFKDRKYKLGIVLARRGQEMISPISAPFGGFSFLRNDISLSTYEAAVAALVEWGKKHECSLEIVLPPYFYAPRTLKYLVHAFTNSKFKLTHIDLNYQIVIGDGVDYLTKIDYNARRNLNIAIALEQNYNFKKVNSLGEISAVYEVIRKNREFKGYPLRMSLEQVLDTIRVVQADFFMLEYDGEPIAAAQIFYVSEGIVQVIYWGDIPGYIQHRPMNYLSYCVVRYYEDKGIKIIDIGPSTENGVPNYGLIEFKESIGCEMDLKYKFTLK